MSHRSILGTFPLGGPPWPTFDPFLFCVHHNDKFPAGNARLGIDEDKLGGRSIGNDFSNRDGWSMYHGNMVPGFPPHPHRGFETISIMRQGYMDHADSLGATARFGEGDVQWMTAGSGIVHSEMFPLLNGDTGNDAELFQVWINLPGENKMVDAHFSMLWNETIPRLQVRDDNGSVAELTLVAGALHGGVAPVPPPSSWAAKPDNEVAVWSVKIPSNGQLTIPAASRGLNRTLYFFAGESVQVDGRLLDSHCGVQLRSECEVVLQNGDAPSEMLMLQGKPIGEPVVQHGPFVMNSSSEIQQAFADYQRTQFGGWPWADNGPVHDREGRFAKHADGTLERP